MPRLRANSTSVSRSPTIAERSRSSGAALTKSRTSPIAGLRQAQCASGRCGQTKLPTKRMPCDANSASRFCVGALERRARIVGAAEPGLVRHDHELVAGRLEPQQRRNHAGDERLLDGRRRGSCAPRRACRRDRRTAPYAWRLRSAPDTACSSRSLSAGRPTVMRTQSSSSGSSNVRTRMSARRAVSRNAWPSRVSHENEVGVARIDLHDLRHVAQRGRQPRALALQHADALLRHAAASPSTAPAGRARSTASGTCRAAARPARTR